MFQCNGGSNSSDCQCLKCLLCPPGQGLYPQCVNTVVLKGNMTMKCRPCPSGMFSSKKDFGSCHACHVCVGQETLKKCTPTQNTVCNLEGPCLDGYKWNSIYEKCEEIPSSPTSPQKPTTRVSRMPTKIPTVTSTNASRNNASKPNDPIMTNQTKDVPTSVKPPTAPHKHNWIASLKIPLYVIFSSVLSLILLAVGVKKREKIIRFFCYLYCSCTGRRGSGRDQQDSEENIPMHEQGRPELEEIILNIPGQSGDMNLDERPNHPPQIGECSAHGTSRTDQQDHQDLEEIISSPPDLQTECANSSHQGQQNRNSLGHGNTRPQLEREQDLGEIITDDLQTANHAAISSPPGQEGEGIKEAPVAMSVDIPDVQLDGKLLTELPDDLKESIALKISDKELKGWKEVGGNLGVTSETLEKFRILSTYPSESQLPGEKLMILLGASSPSLTVEEFIKELRSINRNDVVEIIYKKYCK